MNRFQTAAIYLLAIAVFCLAVVLVYFTVTVKKVSQDIPGIMESISQIKGQIPSILKESAAIRQDVPSVVESINKASDAVVMASKEIEASRPVVTDLTKQIETTTKAIPPMLDQAEQIIDKAEPAVTDLTSQIEATTKAIPPMLDHAEQIVNNAEGIGKKASQGIITGAISGVVKSPFSIVGGIGKTLAGHGDQATGKFNEADYRFIEKTALKVCHSREIGTSLDWNNPDNSNHGTVTLKSVHDSGKKECRTLIVKTMTGEKIIGNNEVKVCRQNNGDWHIEK